MFKKKAYRDPVQYWSGYQTFVNRDSRDNISPPEEEPLTGDHDTGWAVRTPRKREKERPLPLPSSHPKDRDKKVKKYVYNKNDHYPARTKGEPGEQRGHPTKYDYNMPTRRSLKAKINNPGSTSVMRKPSDRQKQQKGVSERRSRQNYLRNRARLKPINRKRWLKKKRDPREQRRRDYYEQYPKRYERKGYSPYDTPAERTKAWREEQKKKNRGKSDREKKRIKEKKKANMWPAVWNTQTKWTESPEGTESTSLRAPNLWDKSQQGLFNDRKHTPADMVKPSRVKDQTNGSGKVFPRDSDLLNNKRVYKEEEINYRLAFIVATRYLNKKR